ncbi:MAG TPA: metallophosphoesterase [Lacipirellulaceae bacterium]
MFLYWLTLVLGGLGHAVLWASLVNRVHAFGIQRRWVDLLTLLCGLALVTVTLAVSAALFTANGDGLGTLGRSAAWIYLAACAMLSIVAIVQRLWLAFHPERRGALAENHTTSIDLRKEAQCALAAPGVADWLSRLPGNQVFQLCIQEKQLPIPRLSSQHGGLRIAHLSDLHMSGRITKAYFELVIEHVNRCEPDIVAITGDLLERNECLNWIPDTFGRLRAPDGVYYVLGNHDKHVDEEQLHAMLRDAGLIYVGGAWRQTTVRGTPVLLAGNELPWYPPAADLSDCPAHDGAGLPVRIVLSHSPDQFAWARRYDVDLIVAGHNHGGQVNLPLLGAVLAPSKHGVRYASGAFRSGNTVMHVSRGTACLTPVRYNCPAEIAILVLQGGA